MINSLELKRFKSITNDKPIRLTNFAILCGSNSSGKSSIIQAILMLSQTFSSRYFKSSISLNGHLVRLGSFGDILDHASKDKHISIKIDMDFDSEGFWPSEISSMQLDYTFGTKEEQPKGFESQFHPTIIRGSISITDAEGRKEKLTFEDGDAAVIGVETPYKLTELISKSREVLEKDYPDYRIEGCDRLDIIPSSIRISYDHTKKIALQLIPFLNGGASYLRQIKAAEIAELEKIILPKAFFDKIRNLIAGENEERLMNFVVPDEILNMVHEQKIKEISLAKVRELLVKQTMMLTPEIISSALLNSEGTDLPTWRNYVSTLDEKTAKIFSDFLIRNREALQGIWYVNSKKNRKRTTFELSTFQHADHYLSYYFERCIKYLGPLRNEPQAMYQAFDLTDPTKVGLKGEYTAAVLHINKSKKIPYPAPPRSRK